MNAFGPRPAALFTNSASLWGLIFLVALLSIDSTDKTMELTVKAGDHSTNKYMCYHRIKWTDR